MSLKKILIQVYSDIHIELWNKNPEIPVNAKYLFLVGDICQIYNPMFYPFLDYCSSRWEKVFYIPGNHEYYSQKNNINALEFEYKYRIQERYKNVFYLNNESIPLNDEINVYGTTFWTIPPFRTTSEARNYIKDYHNISYFNQDRHESVNLDIKYVSKMSNDSFNKLHDYLREEKKKTIVVTHFPPTRQGTLSPYYLSQERLINSYFTWPDNTIEKFNVNNILCWVSGHTHWSYDFEKNGVRMIGNQLGYKSEVGKTRLNENGIYEISYIG